MKSWTACQFQANQRFIARSLRGRSGSGMFGWIWKCRNFMRRLLRTGSDRFPLSEELLRDGVEPHVDRFFFRGGLGERAGDVLVSLESGHLPEVAAVHHLGGVDAVPRRQHAVVRSGRAAALDVAADDEPRLELRPLLDGRGQELRDPAQPYVAELVGPRLLGDEFPLRAGLLLELRPFRNHDDGEGLPAAVAPQDQVAY